MRIRSTVAVSFAVVSFTSLAALLAACVSDDNAGPSVGDSGVFPVGDGGHLPFDATVGNDASPSPDAGGSGDDSGNPVNDSGTHPPSDGGAPVCAPSVRIDNDAGVQAAEAIGQVANGPLRAALWVSHSQWESDQHAHLRARTFAGADAGLIDLGLAGARPNVSFVADQGSHAFAQWIAADGGGARSLFDFTGFSGLTSFSTNFNQDDSMGFAPLPSGALSLYPNPNINAYFADKSTGTGAWVATNLDAGGNPTLHAPALATNAAGRAVATWGATSGGGATSFTYNIATYDGTTWSAPVLETLTSDGGPDGAPYYSAVVALSNGDAKVIFFYNDHVSAQTFSATTHALVGTPEQVVAPGAEVYFASPTPNAQHWVTVDANDQITLIVPRFAMGTDTDLYATRYTGGTWSPAVDIGPGDAFRMHATLSSTGAVAVVAQYGAGARLSVVGPTGNTWSPFAGFNTSLEVNDLGGITFDATHVYVVDSQDVVPQQSALGLFVEVCTISAP